MSITAPLHRASDYLTGFSALELTPSAKARINIRLILEGGLPIICPPAKALGVYVAAAHSDDALRPYLGDLIDCEGALGEAQKDPDLCRSRRFG